MKRKIVDKNNMQIYSSQERVRRDETIWTLVQAILAPIQFFVFIISLFLVLRFLVTGLGIIPLYFVY